MSRDSAASKQAASEPDKPSLLVRVRYSQKVAATLKERERKRREAAMAEILAVFLAGPDHVFDAPPKRGRKTKKAKKGKKEPWGEMDPEMDLALVAGGLQVS